jgi:hypothetical protein
MWTGPACRLPQVSASRLGGKPVAAAPGAEVQQTPRPAAQLRCRSSQHRLAAIEEQRLVFCHRHTAQAPFGRVLHDMPMRQCAPDPLIRRRGYERALPHPTLDAQPRKARSHDRPARRICRVMDAPYVVEEIESGHDLTAKSSVLFDLLAQNS